MTVLKSKGDYCVYLIGASLPIKQLTLFFVQTGFLIKQMSTYCHFTHIVPSSQERHRLPLSQNKLYFLFNGYHHTFFR